MLFFKEEKMVKSYVSPNLDEKKFAYLVKKNLITLLAFEFIIFFLFKNIFFMASIFFMVFMGCLVFMFKDTWTEKYKLRYLFYILFAAAPFIFVIAYLGREALIYLVIEVILKRG